MKAKTQGAGAKSGKAAHPMVLKNNGWCKHVETGTKPVFKDPVTVLRGFSSQRDWVSTKPQRFLTWVERAS